MKKANTRPLVALSSGCLLAVLCQAQAQEQEDTGGFSFSDDTFSMEPAAPAEPVYDNFVEGGVGYNSDDSYRFGRYDGLTDEGAFFDGSFRYLQRGEWNGEDLGWLEATGEDLGLDSGGVNVQGGVQGRYRLFLDYQEIPYYNFQSETPYRGVGSGSLSLPGDWESNSSRDFNTATQNLPQLTSSLREVDIETERTRYGGGAVWNIDHQWTARLKAQREEQDGLKPLGVAWGTSGQNAAAVIVPQPVDQYTDQVDAELGFRDGKAQLLMQYQFSRFENNEDTLALDNPFTYGGWPPASYPEGVAEMSLAPDNLAHAFNISGAYNFAPTRRLTANLGYSRYEQNEALLPYTANPALTVSEGLPRNRADAEVKNLVGNVEFYDRPSAEIDYKLRYRYTDRDNDTPRDLWIYVAGDAENQQTGGDEARYRYNTPYSFTEQLAGADLGYRFQRHSRLSLGYEYRNTDRTYSERSEVDEQVATVGIRHRFADGLSGTAEYAHTWRDGSSYDGASTLLDSYSETYIESLGEAAFINHPDLRMYHLADLQRDKASARLTWMPDQALTLGGRLTYINDDYDASTLGLTGVKGWGLSLDAGYRVNDNVMLTGFYAYDDRSMDQAGWSFYGGPLQLEQSEDPERRWWVDTEYAINTFGAGLDWQIDADLHLSLDYVYTDAVAETRSRAGDALNAGDFPDDKSRTHTLRSDLGYDLSDQTTLGLSYIYEQFRASDWQTDSVGPDTIGRVLSLEAEDPDYDNNVFLLWVRYQF